MILYYPVNPDWDLIEFGSPGNQYRDFIEFESPDNRHGDFIQQYRMFRHPAYNDTTHTHTHFGSSTYTVLCILTARRREVWRVTKVCQKPYGIS